MQVRNLNPSLSSQALGKARHDGVEPGGGVQEAQIVPPPPPKPDKDSSGGGLTGQLLSGDSLVAIAVEADAPPSPPETHGKSASSPAQQARAAIAEHPELGEMPFGQVVSLIARGQPLPIAPLPSSSAGEGTDPAPVVSADDSVTAVVPTVETGGVIDLPPAEVPPIGTIEAEPATGDPAAADTEGQLLESLIA